MGWDRRVLPKDRDTDETFPWMGVIAAIVILGATLLLVWLAFGLFGGDGEQDPAPEGLGYLTTVI